MDDIDILDVILKVLYTCLGIGIISIITLMIIGFLSPKPIYYECIDFNSEPIKCIHVWTVRGGVTKGQTEDGRTLNLESYKPIYKEK